MKRRFARGSGVAIAVGLLLGAAGLVLVFRRAQLDEIRQVIGGIEPARLLLPVALASVGQFLRPLRWWLSFQPATRPRFLRCFVVGAATALANFILPGRGGDLLRWLLISRGDEHPSRSESLATLGVEKLLDAVAVLVVVNVALVYFDFPTWLARSVGVASVAIVAVLVFVFATRAGSDWLRRLVEVVLARVPFERLRETVPSLVDKLLDALHAITSPGLLARLSLLTALVWAGEAVGLWALGWAAQVPLTPVASLVAISIVNIGMMVPAAPGFIGTYELFAVAALRLVGLPLQEAIAMALIMHAWAFAVALARGLPAIAFTGVKVSELTAPSA